MIPLEPQRARAASAGVAVPAVAGSPEWLRLARLARMLSWLTLGWLGVEAGVAIGAAVIAGSVALLGFGLDSGIEALASVIVIWRFTGTRLASPTSERRAQQLVAVSFFLLAPYIAVEAIRALAAGDRAETSVVGLVLTAGTAILEPALGVVKRRIGARLGSSATAGEGTQNLLCAYLALAVFAGLAANTLWGAWWLDGVVALAIAGWAVVEGRRAWGGRSCSCVGDELPPLVAIPCLCLFGIDSHRAGPRCSSGRNQTCLLDTPSRTWAGNHAAAYRGLQHATASGDSGLKTAWLPPPAVEMLVCQAGRLIVSATRCKGG